MATCSSAAHAELNILPRVAVRGGAVATAALCAGALVNAAAALRATARASFTILARVALLGGGVAMASVSVGALVQAAAAMRTAAHAAIIIVVRVTFRETRAVLPAPAQEKRSSPVLGVFVASWNCRTRPCCGMDVVHRAAHPSAQFHHFSNTALLCRPLPIFFLAFRSRIP